ncbi:MAG: DUF58 domain-containing protein [Planctomycetes bacterium]|nr:DUF58 domain-containing protein [Planctomycetota bacterium]
MTRSSLRIGASGVILLALTVVAAIATGIDVEAFGLPFAALLALVLVGVVFALANLRGLRVSIDVPNDVRVGEPMAFDLRVEVGYPLLAPQDVLVRVAFDRGAARPIAFVQRADRGGVIPIRAEHRFGLRGMRDTARVTFTSSAPFGWFTIERSFDLSVRLLVLPAVDRLRNADDLSRAASRLVRHGRRTRASEDLATVRPWRTGESERIVHWKLSAKRGIRVAREFESHAREAMHIVLSTAVGGVRVKTHWGFERCVRLASSLVEHFHAQGHPVRLTLLRDAPTLFVASRHRHGTRAIQRELAVVTPRFVEHAELVLPADATCVVRAGGTASVATGVVDLDVTEFATVARWIGFAGGSWKPAS